MGETRHEILSIRQNGACPGGRAVEFAAQQTLDKLGIPRLSFYRWYNRYQRGGPKRSRIALHGRMGLERPEAVRNETVDLAMDQPEFSPRELAVRFTDKQKYFVTDASIYRPLKAHDPDRQPAYIVIKASEEFRGQDRGAQSALADRLHLSQDHGLGMVLSLHHARRLLALHRRLEALCDHEGKGRHRHARWLPPASIR